MRVILDLEENVLEKLAELAKFQKRSRKNFMEFVLTNHAELAKTGTPEEAAHSVHNKVGQNKPNTAPISTKKVSEQPKAKESATNKAGLTIRDITPQGEVQGLLVNGEYLTKEQVEERIADLTNQMNNCGSGIWGKKMKEQLQNEIYHLQNKLI